MFSEGAAEYKYPKKILKPEATQDDVYDTIMEPLFKKFTCDENA